MITSREVLVLHFATIFYHLSKRLRVLQNFVAQFSRIAAPSQDVKANSSTVVKIIAAFGIDPYSPSDDNRQYFLEQPGSLTERVAPPLWPIVIGFSRVHVAG